MFTKKRIKKILIGVGITFVVLWFGGNTALYLYLKYYVIKPANVDFINTVPERLKLTESKLEADWLPFINIKLKFPYYKEDINHILPAFFNHRLSGVSLSTKGSTRYVGLYEHDFWTPKEKKDEPFLTAIKEGHYSRLKDFSWWNLFDNAKLSGHLIAKAISISMWVHGYKVYDVETPYFKGFLTELHPKDKVLLLDFVSEVNGDEANLTVSGNNEISSQTMSMIASIQKLDNIDESYKAIDTLYKQKKSKYPEELLLLSIISLKGPTLENLEELLGIMQKKNYKPDYIKEVQDEVDFLKKQGKK